MLCTYAPPSKEGWWWVGIIKGFGPEQKGHLPCMGNLCSSDLMKIATVEGNWISPSMSHLLGGLGKLNSDSYIIMSHNLLLFRVP